MQWKAWGMQASQAALRARRRIAVVLVAAAAVAPAARADATDPPAGGPACDQVRGDTLGQTARWRILREGGSLEAEPLLACRRDVPGPAAVRVLGTSKGYDDSGEDSETPQGGPYVTLDAFGDARAVLTTRTYDHDPYGDHATGTTELVDLDRGATALLSSDVLFEQASYGKVSRYHSVRSVMTPGGALAWSFTTNDGKDDRDHLQFGPWTVWDAAGSRPDPVPGGMRQVAVSLGTGGDTAGVYHRAGPGGRAGRLPLRGAADLSATPPDPALAWQSPALESVKPYIGGFTDVPLDVAGRTVFGNSYLTYWPTLEYSTTSKDPDARVRVVLDAGEEVLGRLAPHSVQDLVVLTATQGGGLLVGRFAPHPKQRRVLAAGGSRKVRALFDVPARRSMERPGRAASYGGLWALADGSRLRLWVRGRGHVHRVPGLHDLSQPFLDATGLYATDGDGRVRFYGR